MYDKIFNEVQKLLLFDDESIQYKECILSLFKKYEIKYHNYILKYFLFIYNDLQLLTKILKINISLYEQIKNINPMFEINYNDIITDKNIKIIQSKINNNKSDIINILYYLNDKYLEKILNNDKITCKIFIYKSSYKFCKYIQSYNTFINNIDDKNIYTYLYILDKNNIFTKLNDLQKKKNFM